MRSGKRTTRLAPHISPSMATSTESRTGHFVDSIGETPDLSKWLAYNRRRRDKLEQIGLIDLTALV
jgi:hypothetical protein